MQAWLIDVANNHSLLVYALIIVAAVIEGPILSLLVGVLLRLGYFSFWPVYVVLMIGDLLGDVIWYVVGRYFGTGFIKRFGRYFSLTEAVVEKVTVIFNRHQNSILFISKITTGLGLALAVLFTAGLAKIPFRKYLAINTLGQFIWTALLLGIGYYFSHWYLQFDALIGRLSIFGLFIILVAAFIGLRKYLRARLVP